MATLLAYAIIMGFLLFFPSLIWAISGHLTNQNKRSSVSDRRTTPRLSGTSPISFTTKLQHFWMFRVRKEKPFSDEEIEQQLSHFEYLASNGEFLEEERKEKTDIYERIMADLDAVRPVKKDKENKKADIYTLEMEYDRMRREREVAEARMRIDNEDRL